MKAQFNLIQLTTQILSTLPAIADMTDNLKTQLTELLDEAELEWLKPHIQKDAVILVDANLDILDVGVAIASDNTQSVQHWIGEQLLVKPSPEILNRWNANPSQRFQAMIIQPYILVKELERSADC
jgi:hypothetical protein